MVLPLRKLPASGDYGAYTAMRRMMSRPPMEPGRLITLHARVVIDCVMNNGRPNMTELLETIEAESFLQPTFIASGYGTVADILSTTPEVQSLLDDKERSLPLLRARYRELEEELADTARLVYFVIFGLARDREMLPEIVAYLKAMRGLSTSLIWPWHPFIHGVHSLELITGGDVRGPGTGGSAKQFDEFVTQVEQWARTH